MKSAIIKLVFLLSIIFESQAQICELLGNLSGDDVTPECKSQLIRVCNNTAILWKMFDASSKYPISGLSYSNNRDLGNYDECMSIDYEDFDGKILGKFCGYSVAIINPLIPGIADPYPVFVEVEPTPAPYTTTLLSTCMPDACTTAEVGKFFIWGNLAPLINVVPEDQALPCATKDSNTELKWFDILYVAFLALVLLAMIVSTCYDYMIQHLGRKPQHPMYISFSVLTNGQKLFKINHTKNPDQIECFNGMRFISMIWIISGHNWNVTEYLPIVNYAEVHDWIGNIRVQFISSAMISVDTFFFMTGFLLAYGYLKAAAKMSPIQQILGIPMMIIHRYLRLTPAMAALYFSQVTIMRLMGSGPLWTKMIADQRQVCLDNWWPFFLYIQNYYDFRKMCMAWTWYLSADMQMFVLSPLVLIPLALLVKKNARKTNIIAIVGLEVLIVFFIALPIGYRFADTSYVNDQDTHSRIVDVLSGILIGTVFRLYLKDRPFMFSKLWNVAIWILVLAIDIGFLSYFHTVIFHYTRLSNTLFYGLYKPLWCCSIAWMLYSCYHGFGGFINFILTLPFFQIGARLSYSMYLVHYVVIMFWAGQYRTNWYWGDYNTFYIWCGHLIVTMILSVVWVLAFESPMIVIEKVLFGGAAKKKAPPPKTAESQS